jgi:L,D-transpeptidase ErfK/SrfK
MSAGAWRALVAGIVAAPVLAASSPPVSTIVTGSRRTYTSTVGDTLQAISARHGVDVATIQRESALGRGAALAPGTTLIIDNHHVVPAAAPGERILVNVPQRLIFYFDDGALVAAFPVAVGQKAWATPLGPFTVTTKEESPTWDVPASIQAEMRRGGQPVVTSVPPGPANPLGDYWLGLSLARIGIHGTPLIASIYRAATHGCIRLHPDDLGVLFAMVRVGDAGRFAYEPVLVAEAHGVVYFEVHRDIYGRGGHDGRAGLHAVERSGAIIDWAAVDRVLSLREGVARQVGVREITH